MEKNKNSRDEGIGKVPEDVVIEILVRGGIREWEQISCVKKQWASLFRCDCECFWQAALSFYYPHQLPLPPPPTWPVPLPNNSKRRFIALYISQHIFASDPPHEILGHTYLFLKDQLQPSIMPPHSGILHGTIIGMYSLFVPSTLLRFSMLILFEQISSLLAASPGTLLTNLLLGFGLLSSTIWTKTITPSPYLNALPMKGM